MMYTMEDFLKWLDENEYLKDDGLNYKIITEQYLHSNIIDKIKNIFDSYYHIYNTMVWYEEWENIYKPVTKGKRKRTNAEQNDEENDRDKFY